MDSILNKKGALAMKKKLAVILGGLMIFAAVPAFAAGSEAPYCASAQECYQQDVRSNLSHNYGHHRGHGNYNNRECAPARTHHGC